MKLYLSIVTVLLSATSFAQQSTIKPPLVQKPVYFDISPPLRDMALQPQMPIERAWKDGIVLNRFNVRPPTAQDMVPGFSDPTRQPYNGRTLSDTTLQNFEGLGSGAYIPPDTDGDIGPNHYFQVVNASYGIYNKSGIKLLGPLASSTVWTGMPNNSNDGDAVVLYDENANRWLFSQFSLPNYPNGPFYQMIAVSQTPDPTGSWYRYEYTFSDMPDYPKFGVWPDGYYMSCNRFGAGGGNFAGVGAAAFNRTLMLAGDPSPQMVYFTFPPSNEAFGMLPSDCDGPFPPFGTPNYYTYASNQSSSHLGILELQVDWTNPTNATFGNLLSVPVNTYSTSLGSGIPQLGTTVKLATLNDRLMYRQQFRKFGDHWSMVLNHTVNAGSNIAGIRWYELRKTSGNWGVYQQSTYAPADNLFRWMGSMAMDTAGNIAVGYSVSSSTMYPSIRYTGRLSTDPINQMTIAERGIMNGGGCQTSTSKRWGDYSTMRVDASSPTTFWYSTEYYSSTSSSSWQTRIASFTFANVFSTFATASPVKVCSGDSSQLNAVAYGGSGNYSYSWSSIPPGFSSSLRNPKVSPGDTTRYIVAITDGSLSQSDTTQVMVISHATASAGNDTTVCATLTSIDLHGTAGNYTACAWATAGNGHFSNASTLNTTYTFGTADYQAGSVDVKLVAVPLPPCTGNFVSTEHIVLDPCNAIPQTTSNEPVLILQPNPAKGIVNITVKGEKDSQEILTITNMNGLELLRQEVSSQGGTVSLQEDIHQYPAGIYIVRLKSNAFVLIRRLVVE